MGDDNLVAGAPAEGRGGATHGEHGNENDQNHAHKSKKKDGSRKNNKRKNVTNENKGEHRASKSREGDGSSAKRQKNKKKRVVSPVPQRNEPEEAMEVNTVNKKKTQADRAKATGAPPSPTGDGTGEKPREMCNHDLNLSIYENTYFTPEYLGSEPNWPKGLCNVYDMGGTQTFASLTINF